MTDLIISVSRQMLLKQGYDNTSIDEIVSQTKISKKTFYARFKDKAELFEAVCMQTVDDRFSQIYKVKLDDTGIKAALEAVLISVLRSMLQSEIIEFERMVVAVSPRFPEILKVVDKVKAQLIVSVRELLFEANRTGALAIDDIDEAASRLLDGGVIPLFRLASIGLRGTEITDADRVALGRYAEFFIRGYAPGAS